MKNHNTSIVSLLLESSRSTLERSNKEELSLKQLISVHNALISLQHSAAAAAASLSVHNNNSNNNDKEEEDASADETFNDMMEDNIVSKIVQSIYKTIQNNLQSQQDCIFILTNKEMLQVCHILSFGTDRHILLMVQLLLFQVWESSKVPYLNYETEYEERSFHQTLYGIEKVTFPLLSSCRWFHDKPLLCDALLEASFSRISFIDDGGSKDSSFSAATTTTTTTAAAADSNVVLFEALESCLESMTHGCTKLLMTPSHSSSIDVIDIYNVVEMTCRMMARIQTIMRSKNLTYIHGEHSEKKIVPAMQIITMQILHSICYHDPRTKQALLLNTKPHLFMRPITAILLPSILSEYDISSQQHEQQHQEGGDPISFMDELWQFSSHLIHLRDGIQMERYNHIMDSNHLPLVPCQYLDKVAISVTSAMFSIMMNFDYIHSYRFYCYHHNDETKISTGDGNQEDKRLRLMEHPTFWKFLSASLKSHVWDPTSQNKCGGFNTSSSFHSSLTMDNCYWDVDQMVRRRAIHIFGLLISGEERHHFHLSKNKKDPNGNVHRKRIIIWKKYILVYEALEMESEVHLVNQVWETVYELCNACWVETTTAHKNQETSSIISISWEWMVSLFDRILTSESPMVKKLGLYRLLAGKAGIKSVHESENRLPKEPTGKGRKLNIEPAPLSIIDSSFVLFNVIKSYDAIPTTSGTGVQFEVDGKVCPDNLDHLLSDFIHEYTKTLLRDKAKLETFVQTLISNEFILETRATTLVSVYDVVEKALSTVSYRIPIRVESLSVATAALKQRFFSGSYVYSYRQAILGSFAYILSKSSVNSCLVDPMIVINILTLYPTADDVMDLSEFEKKTNQALYDWMLCMGEDWMAKAGASCAVAFVSVDLLQHTDSGEDGLSLTSNLTKQVGAAIAKMCSLAGLGPQTAPASLLWPAIYKGLSGASQFGLNINILSPLMGQKIARSILLLINGCKERVLGGIGHGHLVLNKHGEMLPLSPNIELLISSAINFIFYQIQLVAVCNYSDEDSAETYALKSVASTDFTENFSFLIQQIVILRNSYPSSAILETALRDLLVSSIDKMLKAHDELLSIQSSMSELKLCMRMMYHMSSVFSILSFSSNLIQKNSNYDLVELCSTVLRFEFPTIKADVNFSASSDDYNFQSMILRTHKVHTRSMRSIFQQCKWGIAFHLVPIAYDQSIGNISKQCSFHSLIMQIALDTGHEAPGYALSSLFNTALVSSKRSFEIIKLREDYDTRFYSENLSSIIETLFCILDGTDHSPTRNYMLSVVCSLIFRFDIMLEEYRHLNDLIKRHGSFDPEKDAPILTAFRRLVEEASTKKPHVSRYALGYISAGWLSDDEDSGLAAIPYRDDIVDLLVHKEVKIHQSNAYQEGLVKQNSEGSSTSLPISTPETSIVRGFLLVFLSKLPSLDSMSSTVLHELCHYLIMHLLDNFCLPDKGMFIYGGEDYSRKMRAWQSLCILSRFVTHAIIRPVLEKTFECMSQILHGGIRFFIEAFTIQVSKRNIEVFIELFTKEMIRCDLSQQHVSSLMIIGGNLFSGSYSSSFEELMMKNDGSIVRDIIAGVFPWLSSTQGFSRAIAQLLIHRLIPILTSAQKPSISTANTNRGLISPEDSFFIANTWKFLDTHVEMKRLRSKQTDFFRSFHVDEACTVEGIFQYNLDTSGEADPPHLVEIIKKSLIDIYDEAHNEQPEWKRTLEMMESLEITHDPDAAPEEDLYDETKLVNFQRKIVPMDSLQLALDEHKESRMLNGAGRKKQSLIICASLIDKATNLAGLTRTAEIFAAEKIVVPDLKVKKMDSFKSICVGAEDWIEMEECKENHLMEWLKRQKDQGYSIVGIEQTSSSVCLSTCKFEERCILLLGKEKEGIPVKYLSSGLVDQCVEIPQLGIIRSLNVHVSGAISIWEYSKQMKLKNAFK